MAAKTRWGILSTGWIAHKFADGLKSAPDAELVAVGSRRQASADAFGAEYGVPHRHGSYEALAQDPDVDVIYIGTPHPLHMEDTLLCLEHGKPVLCEKPFAINAAEARRMVAKAREKKVFMMEAMWTRFNPVFTKIWEILAAGTLGDVRMLIADFGFRREFDPESRLYKMELGGGALLDVGIYPISMASLVFGRQPEKIQSTAHLGQTGSDEQAAMLFSYPGGKIASLTCAVATDTNQVALIAGTKGRISIPSPWWKSDEFVLMLGGTDPHAPGAEPPQVIKPPSEGNLYNYQAVEVGRCLREGLLESPVMPLDETIGLMETLDAVRKPWGLVYPTER